MGFWGEFSQVLGGTLYCKVFSFFRFGDRKCRFRDIAHGCIASYTNDCIVHKCWWSHGTQMMMIVIMMIIASYTDDDDCHHDDLCIVHGWWWLSPWLSSHCTRMMTIVIVMIIASYTDDDDDEVGFIYFWSLQTSFLPLARKPPAWRLEDPTWQAHNLVLAFYLLEKN